MQPSKGFLVIVLLFFCSSVFGQNNLEDVIYLKNGNIYRGIIIETVPGETYKIQIGGGSVFVVNVAEIQKITKEQRWVPVSPVQQQFSPNTQAAHPRHRTTRDSSFVPHFKKKSTYFFLGEVRGGPNNGGIRIVNGYKFGRFGYLGIGIGIDGANFDYSVNRYNNPYYDSYSNGIYLPVYIRYAGDILKKQITPFYYTELGYAAHPDGVYFPGEGTNISRGGPIAAVGFGCKFNTKRRINFNVNLNANWRSNFYKNTYSVYDPNTGTYYTYDDRGMDGQLFGSVGFGIGF